MNVFAIISFVLLGLAAFILQKKRRFDQIDILHLLLVASVAILLKSDFGDESFASVWSYSLIATLAINFLLSRWSKLRRPILRVIPPLISFGVLLGIFWNDSFQYLGENVNVSDKATLILPVMGIIMYELAVIKINFLKKYFGVKDSAVNILMSFFIGVAVLIGAFNAQGYGVFLVASGFAAASFYNDRGSKHILHSMLAVSVMWMFAAQNDIELIGLKFPKVIGGLFVGAFVGTFIQHVWTFEKKQNLAVAVSYVLSAMLFVGMIAFKSQINASFGGVEAYIAGLIGFAIANSVLFYDSSEEKAHQAPIAMSGFVVIFLVGILVPPMFVSEEEKAVQKAIEQMSPKSEEGEEVSVTYLPLDDLSGNYEIDQESALISFKLGPAGSVTKGAIKEFTGSFTFGEDAGATSFDIKLPVLNLTTFMSMRDKSIMGEDYFNEEKYPSMKFTGSSLSATDRENEYKMLGQFEMLGAKKELAVTLQRIKEDGKIVFVGNGELDRREFGMSDDPREGNIVSFEFRVELK